MGDSFKRNVQRNRMRAVILAQCRAGGCTCSPDIELPSLKKGAVRVVTIRHDDDCPHRQDSPYPPGLKERINMGEFDA